ncbi:hypothetical protein [Roseomonas sp. BN140053]|uniref:hypothetical protein n=1 Tax=Roseomonas sp. BN140053 TaxID=3391898 RepID=UPI0039E7655C
MAGRSPARARAVPPSEDLEDAALRLAAADGRNGWGLRAFAWFAWAYNRSVLHEVWSLVDLLTLTPTVSGGPLMSLWRRLAYRFLPTERSNAYLNAATGVPERYSGLSGILLVLVIWVAVLLGFCWLVVAFFPA